MRKSRVPAVVIVLVVAMLALVGCASWFESPTKPANEAIELANAKLQKAASYEDEIRTEVSALDELPATSEGAAQGLAATAALRDTIAKERSELEAAKEAVDSIEAMKVEDEYKQYARLESTAIDTRITMTDTTLRLFDAMDALYGSLKSGKSDVEPEQIQAVIGQIQRELSALGEQAEDEAQAARDFFDESRLGGA